MADKKRVLRGPRGPFQDLGQDSTTPGAALESVQEIDQHLRVIRQMLRRPLQHEVERSRLTGPQLAVLRAVVQADGISLKDLSRAVGLAHSTVSEIVDRLERRGMLSRRPGQRDRRLTRVEMSAQVRNWVREQLPQVRTDPLVKALAGVAPRELRQIASALRILRQRLEAPRP